MAERRKVERVSPRIRRLEQEVKRGESWEEQLKKHLGNVIRHKWEVLLATPEHIRRMIRSPLADEGALYDHLKDVYGEHADTVAVYLGVMAHLLDSELFGKSKHGDYIARGISLALQGKTYIIMGEKLDVRAWGEDPSATVQMEGNTIRVAHRLMEEELEHRVENPFVGILISDKHASIHQLRPDIVPAKSLRAGEEHIQKLPNRLIGLVPHVQKGMLTGKLAMIIPTTNVKKPEIKEVSKTDWREITLLEAHREAIKKAAKLEFKTLGELAKHISRKYQIPENQAREVAQSILNMINHLYYTGHPKISPILALALTKGYYVEFERGERIHEPRIYDARGKEYRPHEYTMPFVPVEIHLPGRHWVIRIRRKK